MTEVNSSNISHIGYDESTKTLKVRFKKGGEYHYLEVPKEIHDQLMTSKSIGAFFAKSVRSAYKFNKAGA